MTQNKNILIVTVGLLVAADSIATAQTNPTEGFYINVNGGGQTGDRTLTISQTFPLYDQTASVASAQTVSGGGLFDLSIGYRVKPKIVGVFGFSTTSGTGDLVGAASIPHPLLFNRSQSTTFTDEAKRSEQSYYLQALWFVPLAGKVPLADKIDVAVGIGPSFTRVSQEVLATVSVAAGTQDATPVIEKKKGTAAGVIFSLDATYMVTPRYGAGAFARYNGGGSTRVSSDQKLRAGGFQFGLGLRARL